jgi:hypothetical protein
MTGRNVSAAFKQAVFAESTHEVFVTLLKITHASFIQDILVCDDPTVVLPTAGVRGIISNGLEYIFTPFTITLPAQNETGIAQAQISVDNVGEELIAPIRNATSAINVTVQIVLASQPDTVELEFDNFRLESVDYDALTVSGNLSMEYYDLEPFPSKRFTPSTSPGVF